jgi:dienelactone hydrolase
MEKYLDFFARFYDTPNNGENSADSAQKDLQAAIGKAKSLGATHFATVGFGWGAWATIQACACATPFSDSLSPHIA